MGFKISSGLTLACFLLVSVCTAQINFIRDLSLMVSDEAGTLSNAWTGGLTAPQFSRIDVDLDGDKDLFIFDRDGARKLVFLNEDPTPGSINYKYAPEYAAAFPELKEWALLRDFDCDGKEDIFTNFQSSIKVYRNISTVETGLQFELYSNQLFGTFDFGAGDQEFPLVCLSMDLPIIGDHDGDGDIDIITFTESATTLYYFRGTGVDQGDCSLLQFECINRCYGMFNESTESNVVIYAEDFQCPFQVADPRSAESRALHAGGSLLDIDVDQNGIKDIIIGDVTYNNLILLKLDDAIDGQDSTISVDPAFPVNNGSGPAVALQRFPAAYYEDINNDGISDLLVAPNSRFDGDDDHSVWFYINEGQEDLPDFTFVQDNFLQDQMIEVGRGAYPVLFDYDGDGLKDLVVANKEYFEEIDVLPSQLALFRNTGTAESPAYTLVDLNWLDIPSYAIESIYPSFGDLDGDGDLDMILGEETGILHYFENTAGAGNEANFVLEAAAITDSQGTVIDIGQFATPQIFDVDNDGKLDLLIGEKLGLVNYFRNTGTTSLPLWTRVQGAAGDSLGGVSATTYLGINGYSVPNMVRDTNDVLHLFLGNETGTIQLFNNINDNLNGLFDAEPFSLDGFREGDRSAVWVEDIDNDGKWDMFYGIINGGLIYFDGDAVDPVPTVESYNAENLTVYPNPAEDQFTVVMPNDGVHYYFIFDMLGKKVSEGFGSNNITVDVSSLSSGLYTVIVPTAKATLTAKVLVN